MVDNLSQRFRHIVRSVRGAPRLTEANIKQTLREVRIALLEADVALPVVKIFLETLKEEAFKTKVAGSLTPGQALIGVVNQELVKIMTKKYDVRILKSSRNREKHVLMLSGLQGVGKTTTAAKIAHWAKRNISSKVLLASCDTYRLAAMEQLKLLAKQINIEFYECDPSLSAEEIAKDSVKYALRSKTDVLIMDTAGRSTIDDTMMQELRIIHDILSPTDNFFVVDAMQGQQAVNVAKGFSDSLPITGVILTKMDGDFRGGAVVSVNHVVKAPVIFTGVGEKIDNLKVFDAKATASRILGMGDIVSLVEKVQQIEPDRLKDGPNPRLGAREFTLEDMKQQIGLMDKMGGLKSLIDSLPNGLSNAIPIPSVQEKIFSKFGVIINSMTKVERLNPAIIKGSRKRRIAKGSGTTIQEVNQLLKQFREMKKITKNLKKQSLIEKIMGRKFMIPKS